MLGAKMGWSSPATAVGSFSGEFKTEWSKEVEKTKKQLTDQELNLTETVRFKVPKRTLWLSRVVWRSDWDVGMLDGGKSVGVRWLTTQPEAIAKQNATLRFGQWVPKEWRAYIRANLPKYVPPKLRNKTGPFKLRRPY